MATTKRRTFLWVFLAVQALFLVWLIVGIAHSANSVHHCANAAYLSASQCRQATETGSTIGVAVVVFFWVAADAILGIGRWIYVSMRRNSTT